MHPRDGWISFLGVAAGLGLILSSIACGRGESPVRFESRSRAVLAAAGVPVSQDPQLAWNAAGTLYLLAARPRGDKQQLVLTTSPDGGDSFSAPVAVSAPEADVMARGEMSPVLRLQGENVYVLWQQIGSDGHREIVLGRSRNAGKTFIPPVPVTVPGTGRAFQGFASLGVAPNGDLLAVWLDGRDPHRAAGTFDVYFTRSNDQGEHWSTPVRVAKGACPCCRPAVAEGSDGRIYVAWRKVYGGEERDAALSVSHDGGRNFLPPRRIGGEHWMLDACPESGPALAVRGTTLDVAWYSGAGTPGVRVAHSSDGGQTFRMSRLGGDVLDQNHPRFSMAGDGRLWLAVQGRAPSRTGNWPPLTLFVARVGADGTVGHPEPAAGMVISGDPALAASGDGRIALAGTSDAGGVRQVSLIRGRAARIATF